MSAEKLHLSSYKPYVQYKSITEKNILNYSSCNEIY